MECKLHNQPKRMTCSRCADAMCSMCAEYIDGNWFCPDCAIQERKIAAGLDYRDFISVGYAEEAAESEINEI